MGSPFHQQILWRKLGQWTNGTQRFLSFWIPMVSYEQQNDHDDFYFCMVESVKGIKKKNRKSIKYPSSNSAIRPVPHSTTVPVQIFRRRWKWLSHWDKNQDEFEDTKFNLSSTEPKLFGQHELSNFIRDLNLSKVFRVNGFTTEGKKSLDNWNKGNI